MFLLGLEHEPLVLLVFFLDRSTIHFTPQHDSSFWNSCIVQYRSKTMRSARWDSTTHVPSKTLDNLGASHGCVGLDPLAETNSLMPSEVCRKSNAGRCLAATCCHLLPSRSCVCVCLLVCVCACGEQEQEQALSNGNGMVQGASTILINFSLHRTKGKTKSSRVKMLDTHMQPEKSVRQRQL